ncbi:MAG: hypothetical protein WDN45_18890 [Caulobacteraceae bacterium]
MPKIALPLAVLLTLATLAPVRAQTITPAAAPPPCEPYASTRYVCDVQVVEDMMLAPGDRWVIGSAMTEARAASI